jgi:hypothetical protein
LSRGVLWLARKLVFNRMVGLRDTGAKFQQGA